jgi:hypothetical protein
MTPRRTIACLAIRVCAARSKKKDSRPLFSRLRGRSKEKDPRPLFWRPAWGRVLLPRHRGTVTVALTGPDELPEEPVATYVTV